MMLSTASYCMHVPEPFRSNICSPVWLDTYTRHNAAVKVNISLSRLFKMQRSVFKEFGPARKLACVQSGGGLGPTLWVSWSRGSWFGVSSREQSWERDKHSQQVQHFWRLSAWKQRGKKVFDKTVCSDSFYSFNWNFCLQKARSVSEPCLEINSYSTCRAQTRHKPEKTLWTIFNSRPEQEEGATTSIQSVSPRVLTSCPGAYFV